MAGERFVALLRGINVGGHKKVEMGRLRSLLEGLGYEDVQTYVQSGNVALTTPSTFSEAKAVSVLERAIEGEFGFSSRVVVRSAGELAECMAADPLNDVATEGRFHQVVFLSAPPTPERVAQLVDRDYGEDQLRIVGRHMYQWCPNGISKSAFFKMNMDRLTGTVATARNWNTVQKLAEMVGIG